MLVTKDQKEVIFKLIYIMYKLHIMGIDRTHVRDIFRVLSEPAPEDIEQWLTDEYKKTLPVLKSPMQP